MLINITIFYLTMAKHFKIMDRLFSLLCTLVTIVLTGICFHKFMLNDDLAQIDFPTYHQKQHAIYPTLTLCFMGPSIFLKDDLKSRKKGYNTTSYSNFLKGMPVVEDNDMIDIDFNKVTLDIGDYLEAVSITSSENQTIYKHCSNNFQQILQELMGYKCLETSNDTMPFHVSFTNHQTKCFSFSVPYDQGNKVQNLRLFIKSKIFPEQLHEDFKFEKNFGVFVHYPQQFFRSPIHKLYQNLQNESHLNVLNFKVVNMEVLRRRNKPNQECNDEWNDDEKILEEAITVVGCKPPHWQTNSKADKCTKPREMATYAGALGFLEWIPNVPSMNIFDKLPAPCKDILEIHYEYSESKWDQAEFDGMDVETNFFEVNLAFPSSTYKEIIHVRAYDVESLMGYVGGYIGMLLGIGLLQVPELLYTFHVKLKETKRKKLRANLMNRRNENGSCAHHQAQFNHLPENGPTKLCDKNEHSSSECDIIWSTNNDVQRRSILNRIYILEAKLEQVIVENRAMMQYIEKTQAIDKKRLQDEILL